MNYLILSIILVRSNPTSSSKEFEKSSKFMLRTQIGIRGGAIENGNNVPPFDDGIA